MISVNCAAMYVEDNKTRHYFVVKRAKKVHFTILLEVWTKIYRRDLKIEKFVDFS